MTRTAQPEKSPQRQMPRLGIADDFFIQLYAEQGRSFPWRDQKATPLGILVAEILLKQTHAGKVAGVWPALVNRYPDAYELSNAEPAELREMISELGFGNQRTSALISLATAITQEGALPSQPEELLRLPYVGLYTAHAVACFAFGQRVPIVDLSIVRVLSRITGIPLASDIRRAGAIWEIARALLPRERFQEHNYGLLDFAATVCKPRRPRCEHCHFAVNCAYYRKREGGTAGLQQGR